MNNFIITGCPRSGTLFLATNMNKSKKWTVLHEAGGYDDLKKSTLESIQERFNKNYYYYGEVNGYLRHHILKLSVSRKALILRDPIDVWISMANRKKPKLWNGVISEFENTYTEFIRIQKAGIKIFLFNRMVSDISYLQDVFTYVGVNDVVVTKEMQRKKLNVNKNRLYHDISEFDSNVKKRVIKIKDNYRRILDVI